VDALPLGPIPQYLFANAFLASRVGWATGGGCTLMSEKYIRRSSAIAARMLGSEMMIMSATDSTFFTLDPVATTVWQAADGQTPLSEIVTKRLCAEYDVSLEMALRDTELFVQELADHGILLVSDRPISDAAGPREMR
jgi:hypothetical protein